MTKTFSGHSKLVSESYVKLLVLITKTWSKRLLRSSQ